MKRILDLLLSGLGIVLLAPVLAACAIAVLIDSEGPILYRQQRIGRFGSVFRMNKFRTMSPEADRNGLLLSTDFDPRITRVGRFLRRYKLDEIPQLLNVIMGEMSIVGPRPEVPKYVAMYPEAAREKILSVRPGMTDLASIEYIDENSILGSAEDPEKTYVREVLPAKLRYCLEYVDRQSIGLDLRIIMRTATALISRRSNR